VFFTVFEDLGKRLPKSSGKKPSQELWELGVFNIRPNGNQGIWTKRPDLGGQPLGDEVLVQTMK
jgi:hypothetical protein